MILRYLVPSLLALALFALPGSSQSAKAFSPTDVPETSISQSRAAYRQAIRNTPLMQRPNRPGHFIGNTLRGRGH
jgi:hypothetical protein